MMSVSLYGDSYHGARARLLIDARLAAILAKVAFAI
jgi:hypothetical protein